MQHTITYKQHYNKKKCLKKLWKLWKRNLFVIQMEFVIYK